MEMTNGFQKSIVIVIISTFISELNNSDYKPDVYSRLYRCTL